MKPHYTVYVGSNYATFSKWLPKTEFSKKCEEYTLVCNVSISRLSKGENLKTLAMYSIICMLLREKIVFDQAGTLSIEAGNKRIIMARIVKNLSRCSI